jgi:hypothetical protein
MAKALQRVSRYLENTKYKRLYPSLSLSTVQSMLLPPFKLVWQEK